MGSGRTNLGALRCKFSGIEVFERGLISSGWSGQTVVRWSKVRAIYYHALRETVTVLLLPAFSTESKKVTLEQDDGVSVTAQGEAAEGVYSEAVAATRERMLAEAIDRFKRGEETQFGRLRLSSAGITYPSRDWGKPRTVPWEAVKQVTLNNGEIELYEAGKKPQNRLFLPDNFDLVIAKVSAVANLEVFLQLARDLAGGPGGPGIHAGKGCPGCSHKVRQRARLCRSCGHVFPPGSFSPEVEAFVAALAFLIGAPARPPAPAAKPGRFLGALTSAGMARLVALVGDDATAFTGILESVKGLTDAEVQNLADCLNGTATGRPGGGPAPPPTRGEPPPAGGNVWLPSPTGAENLAARLNALDEGEAEQLAGVLSQSSPTDVAGLAERPAAASPGEVGNLAADLNRAARAPAAGVVPPPPGRSRKGKPCPRCKKSRTDSDLTCPHCGYTDWGAVIAGAVISLGLLLAALLWAPVIETPLLQGAVRWGGGVVGAGLALFTLVFAVQGLRGARKRAPRGAEQVAAAVNQSSATDVEGPTKRPTTDSPAEAFKITGDQNGGAEAQTRGRGREAPCPAPATAVIHFCCPGCGRRLKAKAEMGGGQSKCPGCNQKVRIPPRAR